MRELIASAMVRHRRRLSRNALVREVGRDEVGPAIESLIRGARVSLEVALSTDAEVSRLTHAALREALRTRGRSLRARLLCTPAMVDTRFVREVTAAGHAWEVRTTQMPPLCAVVVDGSATLVSVGPPGASRASLIQAATILQAVRNFYANVWGNATALTERIHFGDQPRTDTVRQVLQKLRDGVTDEVAARELEVSVRTYRRYVAEIMTLLGAESRFQAGVYAAALGLLPPPEA
ncbi:LuxR family transcriptional regulator [Streptomyces sp. 13-12-16]|uniref:LuxR family transcriptional regulator n=1 Tax=Streptomyces sp. 13-12-16 TaxID=1570823 RepID=UPI00118152EE|nr:LuxR family transcriptional regulator [Streptomyces sp. 13-12-16]